MCTIMVDPSFPHLLFSASKVDLVQENEEGRHRGRRDDDDDDDEDIDSDIDPVIAELNRLLAEIRTLQDGAQVDTQGQNRAASSHRKNNHDAILNDLFSSGVARN